jgi:hypothetical protein
MHFHLPKPLHGWREFVHEVAIIVLGVFIALTAEQILLRWEWHDKVDVAEEAMKAELLGDDGPQMYQRAVMHPCFVGLLDEIRSAVEAGKSRAETTRLTAAVFVPSYSFDSVAHDAANASDVMSHMPRGDADQFTNLYSIMPQMDRTNALAAQDVARIRAISRTGGPLTQAEQTQVLIAVEELRNDDLIMSLDAMWALPRLKKVGALEAGKVSRLMASARKHYGTCIHELPSDFR